MRKVWLAMVPALIAMGMASCDPRERTDAPPKPVTEHAGASEAAPPEPVEATSPEPSDEGSVPEPAGDEDAQDDALPPPEPEVLTAPEGYGQIRSSHPPPPADQLTVHALAGYEVVAVYDLPDTDSPRLGYLRIGTRMMVTPKVEGPGCPKGWHGLPQGGYACASRGLVVDPDRPPYMHRPPPPPRLEGPIPYDYAYVRKWNSPMWWRVPTQEEFAAAMEQRAIREAQREGKPLPGEKPAADSAAAPAEPRDDLPSVTDADHGDADAVEPKPAPAADPAPVSPAPASPAEPVEPQPPVKLPLNPDNPWLEKGFFIALADKISENGHTWWRTARGGYVNAADAYGFAAKDFQGTELPEGTEFPFGFVYSAKGTKLYELTDDGKLKAIDTLPHRTFVDVKDETEIKGKTYLLTEEGQLVRKDDVRLAEQQQLPEGLEPWERWIDISLSKQMLVAYEGTRPVYVTLVSTGRKGTPEEPFETPTGRWRIRSKHVSTTMDGNSASDGNYSIQDVPWTMFFEGSYAVHGAFWHEGFGRVRSHGCVNLGPTDARWLFFWTTPILPEGWHGVHAQKDAPGTTVIVRN